MASERGPNQRDLLTGGVTGGLEDEWSRAARPFYEKPGHSTGRDGNEDSEKKERKTHSSALTNSGLFGTKLQEFMISKPLSETSEVLTSESAHQHLAESAVTCGAGLGLDSDLVQFQFLVNPNVEDQEPLSGPAVGAELYGEPVHKHQQYFSFF